MNPSSYYPKKVHFIPKINQPTFLASHVPLSEHKPEPKIRPSKFL